MYCYLDNLAHVLAFHDYDYIYSESDIMGEFNRPKTLWDETIRDGKKRVGEMTGYIG